MSAVGIPSESSFTAEADKEALRMVTAHGEAFERGIGREFRERCERFYRQYRSFSKLRSDWIQAEPPDRDVLLYDAKQTWGAQLHIPLSFRTIETVVPAAVSQRPRMLYFPTRQRWAENVANVRLLIDQQQDQIDIDLPFQAVMRAGRIYGIGFGKTFWRKEYALRRRAERHPFEGKVLLGKFAPEFQLGKPRSECVFDDPDFEDVDVFDFMWDSYGSSIESCGYVIHRVWRSLEYCLGKIRRGEWATASAKALLKDGREEDHLRALGGRNRYDEVWQARMEASGFTQRNFTEAGEHIHEVWEWHDGSQVLTVLDRSLLVQRGENPVLGMKPFTAYRPTPLQKQMVGIGDLEPLEHLQRANDTTISQVVDAVTLTLARGFAYDSSAVDEEDLIWGPNKAIEVRNARPSDAIFPLPAPEIPSSAFRHMEMIGGWINDIGGVTEALQPQPGGQAGTATEAFLVQAALSRRVQLASRRFEIEVVRRAARAFLFLNQRMILSQREMVLPPEGMTYEEAAHEGQWRRFDIGPAGLMGDFQVKPEGGSMAARNVPQDRQDAQMLLTLAASNPHVDARRATLRALELMGIDDPMGWLKKSEPPLSRGILEILVREIGVDPRLVEQAIEADRQRNPQLPEGEQGGPNVEQMDGAMQPMPGEAMPA